MVCQMCALIKDSFTYKRFCSDCWEGMANV